MRAIFVIIELMIACISFVDVNTVPLNTFNSITTANSNGFNPTTVDSISLQKSLENVNVKALLEALNKIGQLKTLVTETTSFPYTVAKLVSELDDSMNENVKDTTRNLVTELAFLDTAYSKVSNNIKLVHDAIQKNFDVLMKLNILKGMLMEENIRSKGSEPWIKYMSKHKNLYQNT